MWLVNLVAVALCAYFLAKMTTNLVSLQFESTASVTVVPSTAGEVEPRNLGEGVDLTPILKRNIFDSREPDVAQDETPVETEDETEAVATGEAVLTSLGITLISTFAVGSGTDNRSTCIIQGGGGQQGDVYTVNDQKEFAPQTKIVKIRYDRVEFLNKGRLEYVELKDFATEIAMNVPPSRGEEPVRRSTQGGEDGEVRVESTGQGKFVIDRAEIDSAIQNLDKLYTQIRAVPYFKGGRANGLKLLSVRSDSLFAKLGLQRGDILQRINGIELDIKRGLEIFNQLKSESSISMEIERRGQPTTLEYEIR